MHSCISVSPAISEAEPQNYNLLMVSSAFFIINQVPHLQTASLLLSSANLQQQRVGCISLGRSIYLKDLAAVQSVHAGAEVKFDQKY